MTMQEALELTRDIRISDSEDDLCFKAMMIFWIGANYSYDKIKTAKTTRYSEDEVEIVFDNWRKNEILIDGKIHGNFEKEDDNWLEIILISMCGAGVLCRISEKYGTPDMKLKFYNPVTNKFDKDMNTKKTLNDHLFDQLDRLSTATNETIDTEINKAASIVHVAEKILDVARLKLDIIAAGQSAEGFKEIDTLPSANPELVADKKKLTT